ncbi:hypothetical protein [Aeromonas rivipollensis]|uniref:hypothetical protein n=1 Tax=Aeromonas rivipollensis TaxID=948519 RepID=UPI002974FEA4|nr:hypothetical protein [Aeromonas rivipollensis]
MLLKKMGIISSKVSQLQRRMLLLTLRMELVTDICVVEASAIIDCDFETIKSSFLDLREQALKFSDAIFNLLHETDVTEFASSARALQEQSEQLREDLILMNGQFIKVCRNYFK